MLDRINHRLLPRLILTALLLVLANLAYAAPGDTTRVSVSSDGIEGNDGSSKPSTSADGRYVAFRSTASNLVGGDTNGAADVFVHDRETGSTTRVSVASNGTQGNADSGARMGSAADLSISADGRFVAYSSTASNLVSDDTNVQPDVFVHDRVTGSTTRVSVSSKGAQGNFPSANPSISANGRYVAFESFADNLVTGDTNRNYDVFVHDRETGSTTLVSVDSSGIPGSGLSRNPSISANGRYVAFNSNAYNLVSGDTNHRYDVFVHDRDTDEDKIFDEPGAISTTRVSVDSSGSQGNDHSSGPSISADGGYVAFHSAASNLVSSDTNGARDIFVHEQDTGSTTRVSVDSNGTEGNNTSLRSSISWHGRYVAFYSSASNLISGENTFGHNVFVHDRITGSTTLVSADSSGSQGNDLSLRPSISWYGGYVAFESDANNLVNGDTNGARDIFVHDTGNLTSVIIWGVNTVDSGLSRYDASTGQRLELVGPLHPDPDTYQGPVALTMNPATGEIFVWNNLNTDNGPHGMLLKVDPATGLAAPVDPNTPPQNVQLGEIAFGPDGKLYGTDKDLYQINPNTGTVTSIGFLGLRVPVAGLAFSPQGILFGVERNRESERLVTIDPANGTVTVVGTLSQDIGIIGDILFTPDGRLIGSATGYDGDFFFDLDPATATVFNLRATEQFPQGMGLARAVQPAPSPTISSISPTFLQASGREIDQTLTVSGGGFVPASQIRWSGSALETIFVSENELQAIVPSSLLVEPSPVEVTVFTPAPGGGESSVAVLFVTPAFVDLNAYDSAASTDGSGATAEIDGFSATATGGDGTIVVAEYSTNPRDEPDGFTGTDAYFDVYLSSDNTFSEVQVEICDTGAGTEAYWWDGVAWIVASDQIYDPLTGCITVTINDMTSPSLADLTETPFTVADAPPSMNVDIETQEVQYSDGIAPVTVAAMDVGTTSLIGTIWSDGASGGTGLPEGLTLTPAGCNQPVASTLTTCEWTLAGTAGVGAGTYEITVSVADSAGSVGDATILLVVLPEDASASFHGGNPVAVQVSEPGGDSGAFAIRLSLREQYPDEGQDPFPGDITREQPAISLVPVGPGSSIEATSCIPEATGDGYDTTLRLSCNFDQVPVNTYAAELELQGGYYGARAEDVLTVYDPTLGYASGGGWFYWPGTEQKTNFGFTIEYNNKGTNVKGSLLLIRHLPEGTYQVKSNALYGLALGEATDKPFGWASFSGKATYSEPGWSEAVGNHEFVLYAEDRNEPGDGTDSFWIQVKGKDDSLLPPMSMDDSAADHAVDIQDGNIVVPHGG